MFSGEVDPRALLVRLARNGGRGSSEAEWFIGAEGIEAMPSCNGRDFGRASAEARAAVTAAARDLPRLRLVCPECGKEVMLVRLYGLERIAWRLWCRRCARGVPECVAETYDPFEWMKTEDARLYEIEQREKAAAHDRRLQSDRWAS